MNKSENIFLECIVEDGIDYHGHDIPYKTKATGNQEECAAYSATIPGGLFWTWNKRSKSCIVKTSNSRKTKISYAVSGNVECAKKAAPVYKPGIADITQLYLKYIWRQKIGGKVVKKLKKIEEKFEKN